MPTSLQWCFHINLFRRCIFLYYYFFFFYYYFLLTTNCLSMKLNFFLLVLMFHTFIFWYKVTRKCDTTANRNWYTFVLYIIFFFFFAALLLLFFVFQSNNNRKKKGFSYFFYYFFYFTLLPTNVHSFRNNFTQAAFHKVCSQK